MIHERELLDNINRAVDKVRENLAYSDSRRQGFENLAENRLKKLEARLKDLEAADCRTLENIHKRLDKLHDRVGNMIVSFGQRLYNLEDGAKWKQFTEGGWSTQFGYTPEPKWVWRVTSSTGAIYELTTEFGAFFFNKDGHLRVAEGTWPHGDEGKTWRKTHVGNDWDMTRCKIERIAP